MKKLLMLFTVVSGLLIHAQNWSLTGNAGTTPGTNFIGTTDNKDLVFKTNNTEVMRINNQGRFGIGGIDVNYHSTFNGRSKFNIYGESDDAFIVSTILPDDYTHIRISNDSQTLFLQEDTGRVFIGIKTYTSANYSTYSDYKLFVKDGIRTEKVKVDIAANNGWADYVFKKDYKLMPLSDLEKFINKNGHLPEVPTTEEAIANGIELKEMNILLLKKVEELTLYTIEQNKRIDALEKKLNEPQ